MNTNFSRNLMSAAVAAALSLPTIAMADESGERYIVTYKDAKMAGMDRDQRANWKAAHLRKFGAIPKINLNRRNAYAARLSAQQLAKLQADSSVASIEVDQPRYLMSQTVPYGIPMVQADMVSDSSAGNKTVCVVDTGFDLNHEDLAGNNVDGTNDPGTGNWFEDGAAHGSHVAGTIAALNNDTGVVGVMPNGNINLHIVKVFANNGNWGYSSDLVAALEVCQDNGSDVVNMSLGGPGQSNSERNALQDMYDDGMLLVAAAGNDGNNRHSYPASYDSVISVAAIDSEKVVADFSQFTNQVELSGPGVGVLSTVPGTTPVLIGSISSQSGTIEAEVLEDSVSGSATGTLVDCGLGTNTCTGATGNICLIERGDISFADKGQACQDGGGVGVIIYNNAAGNVNGTLNGAPITIPVMGVTQAQGQVLLGDLGTSVSIDAVETFGYDYFDGTSMATPHVAGVAALVWSHYPDCSAAEIRDVLTSSAEDLGTAGRDDNYGYGLVQAKGAVDQLTANGGCGGVVVNDIEATVRVVDRNNRKLLVVEWQGGNSNSVEIFFNGRSQRITANDGREIFGVPPFWAGRMLEVIVCDDDGTACSSPIVIQI